MRDLFRLILIGLLSFAVVGVAMVYSRENSLSAGLISMTRSLGATVADVSQQMLGPSETPDSSSSPAYRLDVPLAYPARWVGLAGFPDQTEIAVKLPQRGDFTGGALDLTFRTEIADKGDGLLTVSVNDTARGQIVLNGGEHTHQLRIALTPVDLAGNRVVLGLAARGTTNSGQICPTDAASSGGAVTLLPDSHLELAADQPISDAMSVLASGSMPLALVPARNPADSAMTIWAAQELKRSGLSTRIGVAGADETAVNVYAASDHDQALPPNRLIGQQAIENLVQAASTASQPVDNWPVSAAALGADTKARSFRGTRRWTLDFSIADLPGGLTPGQLNLRLRTTPLAGNSDWLIRLTLNGNLIGTRRLAGSTDAIALDFPLPAERMLPGNSLVVDLVDTTGNEGVCTRAPEAQAQLLPESALTAAASTSSNWTKMIADLAVAPEISLMVSGTLSPVQSNTASNMLSLLLPPKAKINFTTAAPVRMSIVTPDELAAALAQTADAGPLRAVLAASGSSDTQPIEVVDVPGSDFGRMLKKIGADDVIILVSGV